MASVLPLIGFALASQYLAYRERLAAAGEETLSLARALAGTVERELQMRIAVLQSLALSPALESGDLAGFRRQAETLVAQHLPGSNILMLRENGEQVMNLAVPPGGPLPARQHLDTLREVFATGRPAVSDLYEGIVLRRPVVAVEVPVRRADGSVAYSLSLNPPLDEFARIVRMQKPHDGLRIAVLDRRGVTVARNTDPERSVGQRTAPGFLAAIADRDEGVVETLSREGVPTVAAFSRTEFGWIVAVGVRRAEIVAPIRRATLTMLGVGGGTLALALGAALVLAGRITRPIAALCDLAARADDSPPAVPPPTGLQETDEVARVLHAAGVRRQQAEESRRASEARLSTEREFLDALIRQAPVGISIAEASTGRAFVLNRKAVELLGHAQLGDGIERYASYGAIHADGRAYAVDDYPTVRALRRGEVIEREEMIYRRGDGRTTRFEVSSAPVRDVAGRIVAAVTVFVDVEERRRAEEALRAEEARSRLALSAGRLGSWELDLRSDTAVRSPRHDEIFGYANLLPEWGFEIFIEHVLPEDRADVQASFWGAIESRREWHFKCRIRRADGAIRWIEARGQPHCDAAGRVTRLFGVVGDITDQKQAEDRLRLLAREVDHRGKNMLAVLQAMVRQTRAESAAEAIRCITGRVHALARAHTLLSASRWDGVSLRRLADEELAPYRAGDPERTRATGADLVLPPDGAQAFAMALHELATNAAKHGAFSAPQGRVAVDWTRTPEGGLVLRWTETGGPPVAPPARRGLGSVVIERMVRQQLGGDVSFDWRAEGLVCRIEIPAAALTGAGSLLPRTA